MKKTIKKLEAAVERLENANHFNAARLRRLANVCGLGLHDESDEFILGCAGRRQQRKRL